jgi:Leucine-rich repeat (LRR) protein
MKKIFYLLLLLLGFCTQTNAQTINIPDANFKGMLLNASPSNTIATNSSHFPITIDTNGDGEIQLIEALQVHQLRVMNANISDLTGIEYFANLNNLNCSYNQLTNLNIINTIPNLVTLSCNNNQLISLNISSLTTLEQLWCNNNTITSANLTLNNNLILLECSNNPLGTLDVSALTNLQILRCLSNSLSNLDVTTLINLHTLQCNSNSITSLNVNTLANLKRLDFSNNAINSIDLSALINLEYLAGTQNGLTSLNVNSSPNLIELKCENNEISSLDVSTLTNLEKLFINDNLLTTIDLTALNNLKHLTCSFNLFTTLNINSLTNLQYLTYGNEGLGNIDVGNQVNLESLLAFHINQLPTNMGNLQNLVSLSIFMSEIEEIDVSNFSFLTGFNSYNNSLLSYANLKNGNDFTAEGISFSNNPNLVFVCVNDNDVNNVYNLGSNNGDFHVNSYCTFTPGGDYNTITGSVLMNCDEDNYTVYTKMTLYDGTEEGRGVSFTDQNGEYLFYTQSGTYILIPDIENPSFFTITPPIDAVIFANNNNNEEIVNFCVTPIGIHPDLEVVIAPINPARPGFEATYKVVYRNKGNQILSQQYGVNFIYNQHLMTFVSASITPETQGPGGMNWSYENLMPFEQRSIEVTMLINAPNHPEYPVNINDVLTFTSVISPQLNDENVTDNTYIFNQTVVGSYDPNDIICIEGEVVSPTLIGEELHYVIRFENTGTFYAENVVVAMEIDENQYNISSLKVLESSHDVHARIKNNKVEFFFNEIFLDTGGHGNVLLVMTSKATLSEGDSVISKADIYFDYNFPIITNDAETVFQSLSNPIFENDKSIKIYPNPTSSIVNISGDFNIKSTELYDIQGRLLQTRILNDTNTTIDLTQRTKGLYFIKIISDAGINVEKLIKE